MILTKVLSGAAKGGGPLYAIVEIKYGTTCTGCATRIEVGAAALFRFDFPTETQLMHLDCQ